MEKSEIEKALSELNQKHPERWFHNYSFADGVMSIPGQGPQDNFLIRADIVMELIYSLLGVRSREEIASRRYRLLDLGSAEGLQSIEAGLHGFEAVGVEGRELFIERAELAKRVFGPERVEFVQGDVRKVNRTEYGEFDVTLCLGILYHLDRDSVVPFIQSVSSMTRHLLLVDTHVSNAASQARYKLGKEGTIQNRYHGRFYAEHPKGLSLRDKLSRLRASLDNETSFWLEYESLCQLLQDAGFNYVLDIKRPVHNRNEDFRKTRVMLAAVKWPSDHIRPRSYRSVKAMNGGQERT